MYNNLYALTESLFWVDRLLEQEYENIGLNELLVELAEYNKRIDRFIHYRTNKFCTGVPAECLHGGES